MWEAITAQYATGNGGTYVYYRCTKELGECSQGYLKDDLMIQQICQMLEQVSLPEAWAPIVFQQMDKWGKESEREDTPFCPTD